MGSLAELEKHTKEIMVVHWPVNPEAPFQLRQLGQTTLFHDRKGIGPEELLSIVDAFDPTIIFCSGWMDAGYLKIARKYREKIPVVLLLDNHWKGTLKQRLATLGSSVFLHRSFSDVWVPGAPQYQFAQKLGFAKDHIQTGFYCADTRLFVGYYNQFRKEKADHYPKRLLYVGRYVEFKGIRELWDVFCSLHPQFPDWELWCTGTGELWADRKIHPAIRHFGFVQPFELGDIIRQCGVFVLPSKVEPWGVVVHEMAAAGLPLLCSSAVGSVGTFLKPGINGEQFSPGDKKSLRKEMIHLMSAQSDELLKMGDESHTLSFAVSPGTWINNLFYFTSAARRS